VATIKVFSNHLRIPFLFLALIEAIVFLVSVYSAALVRFQETKFDYTNIIINYDGGSIGLVASIYAIVMMLSMTALGHYQSQQHFSPSYFTETILRCLVSLIIGSIALMILYYVMPSIYMGRGFHLISIVLSFIGIIVIRAIFLHFVDQNTMKRNVLVVGAGNRASTLISEKGGSKDGVSYRLCGYIPVQEEKTAVPPDRVINVPNDEIYQYSIDNNVDEIILAIEDRRKYYPDEELLKCKLSGIKIIDPVCFL